MGMAQADEAESSPTKEFTIESHSLDGMGMGMVAGSNTSRCLPSR